MKENTLSIQNGQVTLNDSTVEHVTDFAVKSHQNGISSVTLVFDVPTKKCFFSNQENDEIKIPVLLSGERIEEVTVTRPSTLFDNI